MSIVINMALFTMCGHVKVWLFSILLSMIMTSVQSDPSSLHTTNQTNDSNDDQVEYPSTANVWIVEAQKSIQDKDYQTTAKLFERAIFLSSTKDIKLYNHFGALLIDKLKNYTYAEKILNMALSTVNCTYHDQHANDNDVSHIYYNMGICQMFLGNYNQSKVMFEESIKWTQSVTTLTKIYYRLGTLLCNHFNDYTNGATMFEKVLKLHSTDIQSCINIANILLHGNHNFTLPRSLQLFHTAIKTLRNNNFELFNGFGVMLINKYQAWTHARAIFSNILSSSFTITDSQRAIAITNLGIVHQNTRNYTFAVDLFKKAIDLDPKRVDAYIRLANLLIDQFANFTHAVQICVEALKIEPQNSQLWQILDNFLINGNISFVEIFASIDNTNNFDIMLRFGSMLIEKKIGCDLARLLLKKCVTIHIDWWNAWYYLGVAQACVGERRDAINSLNNSIQLYPYWHTYHVLGCIFLNSFNNIDEAKRLYEKAIQLTPDMLALSPGDTSQLAMCHFQLGSILDGDDRNESEQLKAMYHFEQAMLIDRKTCVVARVRYALGLLKHSYHVDAAINVIKQGLETNPNNDMLLGMLATIQTATYRTDENTTQLFQTAIYQLNTKIAIIYLYYAKHMFRTCKQMLQTEDGQLIAREIQGVLQHAINIDGSNAIDESYRQLILLKMETLNDHNELEEYQRMLQLYEKGLNQSPESCLLHMGKAHLLENKHFRQYNQSIVLYRRAIQLSGEKNDHHAIANAMLNLASLLIDHFPSQHNDSRYLIQQVCKNLIQSSKGASLLLLEKEWVGNFESTMIKFKQNFANLTDADQSLISEVLGLYYESLNQFQQASIQLIMSIHYNDKSNNQNDLIAVSYWKLAKILSCYLNNSNYNTTQAMKHFSIAFNQSSRAPTNWNNFQMSELYYDFGYFLQTKMHDIWNATKYYSKSIELNSFNIKAKEQLDQIIEQNEHIFSQFDKCTLCLNVMIDSFQYIHTNNCTHGFHTSCIDKWYKKQNQKTCPLCRKPQS